MKKNLFIVILIILVLINCIEKVDAGSDSTMKNKKVNISKVYQSNKMVKVEFYKYVEKDSKKKKYVGYAILKNGNLSFQVTLLRLHKLLNRNFHTILPVKKGERIEYKSVTYKVGTVEHLKNVIEHCKDISCTAVIKNYTSKAKK